MLIRSLSPVFRFALGAGVLAATLTAQETIKLGEFASLTGKEASYGQSVHQGAILALEEANAAGGVLGRKLELITEDNQSKPGESATVVKKLISREKVVIVLGDLTSGRTLEAAPICQNEAPAAPARFSHPVRIGLQQQRARAFKLGVGTRLTSIPRQSWTNAKRQSQFQYRVRQS